MTIRHYLIIMLAVATLSACGGEPSQETEDQTREAADSPEANTAESTPTETVVVDLPLSSQEAVLKPLQLRPERYVAEMSREEIERAYRNPRGEYIDPRRVIELLREGVEGEIPETEAAAESASPGGEISWKLDSEFHQQAIEQFDAGDYAAAALSWGNLISGQAGVTISVEVDCDPDILRRSYGSLRPLGAPLFLIPVTVEGRDCYRLCLGLFGSRSDAADWLVRVRDRLPDAVPFVLALGGN